ncbi:MAG TPA: TonB-dependent receptor [Rhodothermales bacterium]
MSRVSTCPGGRFVDLVSRFPRSLALVLALLLAPEVDAQTATIRGFVRDESDGQGLQGVNVILSQEGSDAFLGSATDVDGLYAISRVPAGTWVLRATFIGYEAYVDTIALAAGEIRTHNFSLVPDEAQLEEVVVEAESETAGAASVSAGLQTIRPSDIEVIPSPDVSADLVNYLVTLPGVVATGDRGGQLFVRGGEPTQNLVLIDGMLLYQPFHLVGFYSAFPSDVIASTDVYAGGFGARYGGHLSSVIDVSARSGNKRRFAGAVSVAPFVSAGLLEGPLWKDRLSFIASYRKSLIEEGASKLIDQSLPFDFDDQFGKLHLNLSQNSQLSVTGIRTFDRGVIGTEAESAVSDPNEQVTWTNHAIGGRYILLPASLPLSAELLVSASTVRNTFGAPEEPSRSSRARQYNFAANLTHFVGPVNLGWGLFLRSSDLSSNLGGTYQNLDLDRDFVTEAGFYGEPEFRLPNGLRIQPGLRLDAFPSKGRTFIEPRLRTSWELGRHRLNTAWGIYHQEVVGLNDRRDAGDVFTAWTTSPLHEVPQAIHYIAGYNFRPSDGLDLSIEGFYKTLSNLSVSRWSAFPRFTTELQPADGTVIGFDVRAELEAGPFYGFASYGYADVTYRAQQEEIQYWFGQLEQEYSPPHDRTHQVNALAMLELFDFALSVRWQFGSGLPFSEALGFDTFVLLAGPTDVLHTPGQTRVLYGEPYEGRLPTYHRLDVSLDRRFDIGEHVGLTAQVSLINTYDRRNLFYLDLYTLRRVDQLPLIPAVGLKLEFNR